MIEQAQILTTHNLAALTGPFGIGESMTLDWSALAGRCFDRVAVLARRLHGNPLRLRTVKDLAYAWRHMVFFLSRLDDDESRAVVRRAGAKLAAAPDPVASMLRPALAGLDHVVRGGELDPAGHGGGGRRLLGWTLGPHWLLEPTRVRIT